MLNEKIYCNSYRYNRFSQLIKNLYDQVRSAFSNRYFEITIYSEQIFYICHKGWSLFLFWNHSRDYKTQQWEWKYIKFHSNFLEYLLFCVILDVVSSKIRTNCIRCLRVIRPARPHVELDLRSAILAVPIEIQWSAKSHFSCICLKE